MSAEPRLDGPRRLVSAVRGPLGGNLMARVGALLSLSASSLLLARTSGPPGVGLFTLLRLLPWLTGLICSCGIYGAAPYFLSGAQRIEKRYRVTLPAMAVAGGLVGGVVWASGAPLFAHALFKEMPTSLVMLAGLTVLTQLLESTAKACSQGFGDLGGSNRIMVLEEFLFIPWYLVLTLSGVGTYTAIVLALLLGDVTNALPAWGRLARRGYFTGTGRPSYRLARDVAHFGARSGVGSVMLTLNARLDFALVGAIVGPGPLGVYAVASRYAELLRLPSLALNYVLYPAYAKAGGSVARARARAALARVGWAPALLVVPMALAAPIVLPLAFGSAFDGAIAPACVLLLGLAGGGVNGIVTAYFSGDGRPGRNSLATGVGLLVTVVLDVLLIPRIAVMGAAVASTVAYLTTTAVLVACFRSDSANDASADLALIEHVTAVEVAK